MWRVAALFGLSTVASILIAMAKYHELYFTAPLDGMLDRRILPPSIWSGFPGISPVPIYTPGWRVALYVRVKSLT